MNNPQCVTCGTALADPGDHLCPACDVAGWPDPFLLTDGPAPPMTEQDRENLRWLARESRRINYGW